MDHAGGRLLLAFLSIRITYLPTVHRDTPFRALFTPLVILAIPLYDLRVGRSSASARGKSPFVGDQRFSHRLVRHGLSRRSAVLIHLRHRRRRSPSVALPSLRAWLCVARAAADRAVLLVHGAVLSGRGGETATGRKAGTMNFGQAGATALKAPTSLPPGIGLVGVISDARAALFVRAATSVSPLPGFDQDPLSRSTSHWRGLADGFVASMRAHCSAAAVLVVHLRPEMRAPGQPS